jgi:integrase
LKNYLDSKRDNGKGISKRRYNAILGKVKFFCKWMVKQNKQNGNLNAISPVEYMDGLDNPQTDSRHPRRALELDDFRRFLEAALTGPEKFGLTGRERNFIYRFATETGMRKIDFNRLRVQDCDFKNNKITIAAGRIKNKQDSEIFLKPTTAVELKQRCANKLPNAKVFHLPDKTSKMIQFDLANTVVKDAKSKVIVKAIPYKDNNGRFFDFHSLRHQSASLFGMNPETPESVRQKLTRHKSPEMARHYTHAFEYEQRRAIEALPDLTQLSQQTQAQTKTGTDGINLSNTSFMDDTIQNDTTHDDKKEIKKAENALLQAVNKGEICSTEPKVRGSNPFRRIAHLQLI